MLHKSQEPVLVIIDVQKGFSDPSWGHRNNPEAENVMKNVLEEFRNAKGKIIHVRHDSLNTESLLHHGKESFEFKNEVLPVDGEIIITKHVNSAFIGTDLESILRTLTSPQVYFMGLVTDHCVSTTVRMSANLGFNSYVIEDACATHNRIDRKENIVDAQIVHDVNIASLKGEFAKIVNSKELIA